MRPSELNAADFIGFDSPPVIVGRPNERVTVPIFISHYSDRPGPPVFRWWVSGFDDKADIVMVSPPQSRPAEWVPYGVKTIEPVTFSLPPRPFVGALMITLRDKDNHRFGGNYVNIVVKPEKPLPRIERQAEREVVIRFAPGEAAAQRWSGPAPARRPHGKVVGQGKGFFEYRLYLPESVIRARPERFEFRFEIASKAGKEKLDWPSRTRPQDYPQTDTRKWPSTLEITLNGHVVDRDEIEDDAADARGVLSHLARVDHGSYGELVDGEYALPDQAKADLMAGRPLVLRLAVPENAASAGGLCLFGADTGQYPFDPTIVITTAEPLPRDLGVDPDKPVTVGPAVAASSVRSRD